MDPEVVETYAVLLIIVQSFFQLPATILLCEVGNAQRGADPAPPGGEVPQNGDNAARPSGRPGARPLENGREAFDAHNRCALRYMPNHLAGVHFGMSPARSRAG